MSGTGAYIWPRMHVHTGIKPVDSFVCSTASKIVKSRRTLSTMGMPVSVYEVISRVGHRSTGTCREEASCRELAPHCTHGEGDLGGVEDNSGASKKRVHEIKVDGWRSLGLGIGTDIKLLGTVDGRPIHKRKDRLTKNWYGRSPTLNLDESELGKESSNVKDRVNRVGSSQSVYRKIAVEENIENNESAELADASIRIGESVSGSDREQVEDGVFLSRSPAISQGGERLKINLYLELYRARCLRRKGKKELCEEILRQCIRSWPDDGRPYVALGKQLMDQNKIDEARKVFEEGCQAVRGENPYIWQAWAGLEEKSGHLTQARRLFDAATVADKKHVAGWHGWAILELRQGNIKRARALLNKGLKFCGSSDYIFQTLAGIEVKAGRPEQARSFFIKATQHNPKSAASWLSWALMESQHGSSETSRRLFQKGIEASPRNRYVWQAWALFEAKQGNKEYARELFQRGHELNPKDGILLQAYALFEYECGRPGVSRDLFTLAMKTDRNHQPIWIAWGWMECKEGNVQVARNLYQGAIQKDSRSMDAARAFQAWGILEEREGNSGVARDLFKCALQVDSQNVPAWMSWAAMEERDGRAVRADEIRNLFLQQRTEIVDGVTWDVDLSELLTPAIDRIKDFLKFDKAFPWSKSSNAQTSLSLNTSVLQDNKASEDFQLGNSKFNTDQFLKEKFPWRYTTQESFKRTQSKFRKSVPSFKQFQ